MVIKIWEFNDNEHTLKVNLIKPNCMHNTSTSKERVDTLFIKYI